MSYIPSRIRCDQCRHEMNVAFGIIGMTQVAGWPTTCPKCGHSQFTKIADGWQYDPVVSAVALPPDIGPIRERATKATEGPWTNGMRGSGSMGDAHMCRIYARRKAAKGYIADYGEGIGMTWHPEHVVSYVGLSRQQNVDNAEFIAHARQDIPALIAEIERLEAALAALSEPQRTKT